MVGGGEAGRRGGVDGNMDDGVYSSAFFRFSFHLSEKNDLRD